MNRKIEQHLVKKCKKGDKRSQFKVYQMYYKAMYNTSLRITGNPQEAEEAMQDAFLSAFENIGTFTGKVTIGAWLKKIVINKSLDTVKQNAIHFEEVPDKSDEPENKPDENIALTVAKVQHGIELLPDGYRIVLSLFLLEGYDHSEISQILNITESASRSQYTRAKQKLLEIINQEKWTS